MEEVNCFHPNLCGRIKRDEVEKLAKAKLKFIQIALKDDNASHDSPGESPRENRSSCSTGILPRISKAATDPMKHTPIFHSKLKRKRCPATKWWVVGEPCLYPKIVEEDNSQENEEIEDGRRTAMQAEPKCIELMEKLEERQPAQDSDMELGQLAVQQTRRRVFAPANAAEVEVPQTPAPNRADTQPKTRTSKRTRRTPASLRGFSLEQGSKKKSCSPDHAELGAVAGMPSLSTSDRVGDDRHVSKEEEQRCVSVAMDIDAPGPSTSQPDAMEGLGGNCVPESQGEMGLASLNAATAEEPQTGAQLLPTKQEGRVAGTSGLSNTAWKGAEISEAEAVENPPSPEEVQTTSTLQGVTPPTPQGGSECPLMEASISSFHCPEKLSMHEVSVPEEPPEMFSSKYSRSPLVNARVNGHCKPMRALAPLFLNAKGDSFVEDRPNKGELLAAEATISNLLSCVDMAASPPPPGHPEANIGGNEQDPQGLHLYGNTVSTAADEFMKVSQDAALHSPADKFSEDLNLPSPQDPFEVHNKIPLACARKSRGARLAGLASERGAGSNSTDGKPPDSPGSNAALRVTLKIPKQNHQGHTTSAAGGENAHPSTPLPSLSLGSTSHLSSPISPQAGLSPQVSPQEFATPAMEKLSKVMPRSILKPSSPPGGGGNPDLEPPTPPLLEELALEFAAIREILQKQSELSAREEFKEIIERLDSAQAKAKLDSATKKARKSVTFAEGEALKAVRLI